MHRSAQTLVHRGAQLDVPRSHGPSALQLETAIMPVHNLDICGGCVYLIIFGLALRNAAQAMDTFIYMEPHKATSRVCVVSSCRRTPQRRCSAPACDQGPSSARWSGLGSGGRTRTSSLSAPNPSQVQQENHCTPNEAPTRAKYAQ